MKIKSILISIGLTLLILLSFTHREGENNYQNLYFKRISAFKAQQIALLTTIKNSNLNNASDIELIHQAINKTRLQLKGLDFWLRYLEPVVYKKINGPLPVEWETEVFEKFEKPYKREAAGLTLAALYLDEKNANKDTLLELINTSIKSISTFEADSITKNLKDCHHFFLCNRLHLLNLAAIYTTGFECPDTSQIITELHSMLKDMNETYEVFNQGFKTTPVSSEYLKLYNSTIAFVEAQPKNYSSFDHFTFIQSYVNPLYEMNQNFIQLYQIKSRSFVDYSINNKSRSIFDKELYNGQNAKGIYLRVTDAKALNEIDQLGRLLFYDPILSGNNQRSCASCHLPTAFFTDTVHRTSIAYDGISSLTRNSPSLLNAGNNHLIMLDGKHISLQNQTKDVITNPMEMGGDEKLILEKILSCKTYRDGFTKLLKYTPQETTITFQHITSAITLYYNRFSQFNSPFDKAMNKVSEVSPEVKIGFNLFMSRSQCATCHFVPQFNGIKPPYVSSEFEVLGVPDDTAYKALSADVGRYGVNPAFETKNAFRTGTIRNAEYTKPYMHNGVFSSLKEVINFYNTGGGAGHGLNVPNQTLSADSLGLSDADTQHLIQFIQSLNETITFEKQPHKLPHSSDAQLNNRKVGGTY